MHLTGTHIAYLHTCHRKLWLFAHGIQMEHTSDLVAEGKLIAETTYLDRARKYTELAIDGIKIDFYDAENKVVHEVKKTDKVEQAHIAQVKYYLYILARNGIPDASGRIEYPKMKQTQLVNWEAEDQAAVERAIREAREIISRPQAPPRVRLSICKRCSYFDFCYAGD